MILSTLDAVAVFGGAALVAALAIPCLKRYIVISYRWTLVVYFMTALMLVITDAAGLDDGVRQTVVVGCIVICAIFLIFHSLERIIERGAMPRFAIKKGDISADISLDRGIDDVRSTAKKD